MNKLEELQALRESAVALKQTANQVEANLAVIAARIDMSLDELKINQDIKTLTKVKVEIDYLVDKLADTSTIVDLIISGKRLEQKLHELDNTAVGENETQDKVFCESDFADPETIKRIEQKIELDSLIKSLYPEDAKTLKNIIDKLASLRLPEEIVKMDIPTPKRQIPSISGLTRIGEREKK